MEKRKRRTRAEMALAREEQEAITSYTDPVQCEFKNNGKRNVFTTKGRCGAGETVTLVREEGLLNKGLEEC